MDQGFIAFDALHVSWLLAIAIGVAAVTYGYVKALESARAWIKRVLAYSILLAEGVKLLVVWQLGKPLLFYIPIHLCGLAIVLLMLHAYRPFALVNEILFSLTLPGALIALLFPGWTDETAMGFLHIHSFVYHGIITAYPIMLLASGELKPQARQLWKVGLFLLVVIPLTYQFNAAVGTNYMFLNRPIANSPLMLIYETFGERGYIWGLVLVAAIMWVILYGGYAMVRAAYKHRRKLSNS
ncbi:YwaF family protein [Paenibacillus septentrionalis]|uniref:YwaF family protein n=1 Tax=Paenibacillus septentrionalis TaxID=429342 RepID=A0ABW1V4W0_9BACL